ncbi:MAG: hypothetical protein KatS3mg060_3071 [Dehalococcoidia bacterium]|nr:MAG: hypothetical protein KatS3mg060_3071 [Dehalococcoidia bacterium]
MDQTFQLIGALLILAAFVGAQTARLPVQSLPSILLNLIGSVILAVIALIGSDWGFLLLETVWALVSAWALVKRVRNRVAAG